MQGIFVTLLFSLMTDSRDMGYGVIIMSKELDFKYAQYVSSNSLDWNQLSRAKYGVISFFIASKLGLMDQYWYNMK